MYTVYIRLAHIYTLYKILVILSFPSYIERRALSGAPVDVPGEQRGLVSWQTQREDSPSSVHNPYWLMVIVISMGF